MLHRLHPGPIVAGLVALLNGERRNGVCNVAMLATSLFVLLVFSASFLCQATLDGDRDMLLVGWKLVCRPWDF